MQNKTSTHHSNQQGQSMVEYVLIVVLVILAFAIAIAATGPAIGNVFSNTVYNLLGTNPDEIKDLPDKQEFWDLVTWVAQQTPIEESIPTRTLVPPTEKPTDVPDGWLSPTPSPTYTKVPTNTPEPSPTPEDLRFEAPWHDSADDYENWRLGGDVFLGTDPGWYAKTYADRSLSSFTSGGYISEIDPDLKYNLDFNWGSSSPNGDDWPAGNPGDQFSVSFRRHIYLEDDLTLLFSLEFIDDSARIWILDGHQDLETADPADCSATGVTWGGTPSGSGNPVTYGDDSAYPTDCLLLNGWWGIYGRTATVARTVSAGSYTVVVDMSEGSGGSGIKVGIDAAEFSGNPDDTLIDSGGNEDSGAPDCSWNNRESSRNANSADFFWDSYDPGSNFADGNRCYLELRGSVKIPTGMIDPVLSFWDIWDFGEDNMRAWVEVAEYLNDDGEFDRADLDWTSLDIHTGNSTNYNWTYQEIDLRTMLSMTGTQTMEDTEYAIRFGMEVPEGLYYPTGNHRGYLMWWVDSINIDVAPKYEFYTKQLFTLDSADDADYFITSGRWELSNFRTRGSGGMSWDDSPYSNYSKTDLDGCGQSYTGGWSSYAYRTCSNYDDQNLRMHSLEFNGVVDLDNPLGVADLEGDTGDAILSFWHSFAVDDETGLEIQYTIDRDYDSGNAPEWKLVPGGQLNARDGCCDVDLDSLSFTEINLEALKEEEPGETRFRIRFVMTLAQWSQEDPGWWIDDIQLERASISSFLPYPYFEDFEDEATSGDWLLGGGWGRVDNIAYAPTEDTEYSLTDSPYTLDGDGNPQQVNYAGNQDSTAQIRLALDLHNNTPANPYSPACTLVGDLCDEPDNDTPIDPILTFQWWHHFDDDDDWVFVEWKKSVDSDNAWKELWSYRDCMWYNESWNCDSEYGKNWQRVEIDLRQLLASTSFDNNLPDSVTDDDILIRFRFRTDSNGNNADGVYIDEIRIDERNEKSIALWDEGVEVDIENPDFPSVDPLIYTTDGFRYVRMVAESSVNGQPYAGGAEFSLIDSDGNDIDQTSWDPYYTDSEQASNYLLPKMFDGDINTFWHTEYTPNDPLFPHEFRLDLGAKHEVAHFKYTGRQNSRNTRIEDYKFYVSNNQSDWELAGEGSLSDTSAEQTASLQIDYTTDTPPVVDTTTAVAGTGVSYRDNLDDRANEIFDNWYIGGTWNVVDWEQYDGNLAFHSSTNVPWNSTDDPETAPPDRTKYTVNSARTYNVLEMATIIDLRATHENRKPIMTFWQRHDISGTDIRVQIAVEDTDTIGSSSHCRSTSRDQCYEHYYGWTGWETAPPWNISGYNDWNLSGDRRQFLWKREIVDLSSYAATDSTAGKRIRIRFVSDSLDNTTGMEDGWYIDNVEFKYNLQTVVNIDADTGDSFFDAARNTRNWMFEGTWGLSPELFRGSGGGPADFGGAFWTYWYYDMDYCPTGSTSFPTCVKAYFDSMDSPSGTPDDDPGDYLVRKGLALDINNDWGSSGPFGLSSYFGGIWEITTPVIGTTMTPGTYTFVFTYDDALRVKFDTSPAGGLPTTDVDGDPIIPSPYDPEWNIYDDFTRGTRQVGIGNATFETGKQYKVRMEYFDRRDDATFIMSLGSSSFSFTDSPKQASGAAFPEVPAAPRATSSMIFNGVFDLKDAVAPILRYYTYHELGGAARVEVTRDGGFLWTEEGLAGSEPSNFWTSEWSADFWDDDGRSGGEKMAYRFDGNHLWDPDESDGSGFAPDHTDEPYGTDLSYINWNNWPGDTPVSGWDDAGGDPIEENWSAQFRRKFSLAQATEIEFTIRTNDGHRLWLNEDETGYYPACQSLNSDGSGQFVSGRPTQSGENGRTYGDGATNMYGNGCLLATRWSNSSNNYSQVVRTIPAGDHELIVDYYEATGSNTLALELVAGVFDEPTYYGTYMPDDGAGEWREKNHSLNLYAGYESSGRAKPPIGLRFRLDRLGVSEGENWYQASNQSDPHTNWMESWWVTDILVQDTITGP
jgi:hypothetical protein